MALFDYSGVRASLRALAEDGVMIGTSSWKYPGWFGMVYDEQRYLWRGKVSESRFEKTCLEEYAQLFPTVCVDAAYYRFPDVQQLKGLAAQVPKGFKFSFKVTDDITVRRFPKLPRFGPKGGQLNPYFLNADLFRKAFLGPCEAIGDYCGLLIFEFSTFHPRDFDEGFNFLESLDAFLGSLPKGWNYGVEIRNRDFLGAEYFALLRSHSVTHVFNSWADMPSIAEQWALEGSVTNPACVGARLLLKPGRKYQQAVDSFQPYTEIKEAQPEVRLTAAEIIKQRRANTRTPTFIYVNNRLEGNAPQTIEAIVKPQSSP